MMTTGPDADGGARRNVGILEHYGVSDGRERCGTVDVPKEQYRSGSGSSSSSSSSSGWQAGSI